MMLFVYDFEFNLLLVEKGIISSRWTVYYNDVGTFEAHLPITSELSKIISENRYIVIKQHGLSAIVVGYELSDELIIYGRTCNWLLSKRITQDVSNRSVFPGEKAATIVSEAFSDVDNFIVENETSGDGVSIEIEEGTTLSLVKKCLDLADLGHELTFDEKEKSWRFSVLSGTEKEIILSEAHKNTYNTGITFDLLDYATCGTYDKETDDGYERKQIVKDADKEGIYRWEAKLSEHTPAKASEELLTLITKYEISADTEGIFWKKDYNLGDMIRVQVIKGNLKKNEIKRIVGVEVCVNGGRYTESPKFK